MLSFIIPVVVLLLALLCEMHYSKRCFAEGVEFDQYIAHKYNVMFALLLFLIAALRSSSTGADTGQYYAWFERILSDQQPLSDYFDAVVDNIFSGSFTDGKMWELFMKFGSFIIPNAQLWMAFISGIFIFACYKVIKRYSLDPIISWVYVYSIYIYNFILQGWRQSIAMAIILLSFKYVDKRKLIKFLLMIALAYLFHQSAVIFVIAYPLAKFRSSKLYFIPIFGAFALSYILPDSIVSVLQDLVSDTRFNGYKFGTEETLSIMGWVLLLIIFVFCFIFKDTAIEKNKVNNKLLTMSMIGLVIQSFVGIMPEMFRVSYYFNMFNMLLTANICVYTDGRIQKITRYGFILFMIAYVFYGGVFQYKFFWQS